MRISTKNPGLVMLNIDSSHSTGSIWDGKSSRIIDSINENVNKFLHDLTINVVYDSGQILDRIKLNVTKIQGESPEWALDSEKPKSGYLKSNDWVQLAKKIESRKEPIWVQLSPEGKTPIVEAWENALEVHSNFLHEYPNSNSILITITDGSLDEVVNKNEEKLISVTDDLVERIARGNFLHMIIHISAEHSHSIVFPEESPNDKFGKLFYDITSNLPTHLGLGEKRRAYVLNADPGMLSSALQLGSTIASSLDEIKEEE